METTKDENLVDYFNVYVSNIKDILDAIYLIYLGWIYFRDNIYLHFLFLVWSLLVRIK